MRRTPIAVASLLAVAAATLVPARPARAQDPTLSSDRVSAQGRQSAILQTTRFGRYSIQVESPQGTGLQLTDRMAGPGQVAGIPGERDGRLDVFLDGGEYLVTTLGHRAASGDATLRAHAFQPASAAQPPRLEELRLVSSSLRDLQEQSWWLDISTERQVALEAAGRSLADLRLWKDGRWLVDAAPTTRLLQPRDGRPLFACRLSTTLEPGLYLVTAYGGPEQPWAEESDANPLYLRWGIPRLGSAGRRRQEVSPFGIDRFLVPGAATAFRIELPEARPVELRVGVFDPEQPLGEPGVRVAVEKESVPPVAELEQTQIEALRVVTVTGETGQPYVLQHFQRLDHYSFSGRGLHWVSTIHSGHAADSIDATGVLIEFRSGVRPRDHVEPLLSQVVEIGRETAWQRRANLLGLTTLLVRVRETGSYSVTVEDAEAAVRVEPFLISTPQNYQSPPFRVSGEPWDLDAGFYKVTLEPKGKGVAAVELRPTGMLDRLLQSVGLADEALERPVLGAVRFEQVRLRTDASYRLYVNEQPGVSVGAVVRSLPLDLSDPLPVWQRPGEEMQVSFQQDEAGALIAEAEDGERLEVSVDGGPWQRAVAIAPGRQAAHTARVRVGGSATRAYGLTFVPERLDPTRPLPDLSPDRLASLPEFPALALGSPVALDVSRDGLATYLVEAPEPGLYRLESTGLLATEGNLRTRTTTSLVRRAENGVGRNFAIQSYLTPGDYQVSVRPLGRSAGHLGVSLERTPLRRGGFLTLYRPARASLRAGEAVEYRFIITEPGEFRVRALRSQGRGLRCRLDDRDGWPVVPPEGNADVTRRFDAGHYRFVVLPQETDSRVVSLIEPVPHPRRFKGHGPHRLPLARRVESVWTEPESDAPRVPDVWDLALPADADLRLEVGGEMRGRLLRERASGEWSEAADVPVRRGFAGRLEKGRYRLELVSARVNNRAPYTLAAWPTPLMAGLERELALPDTIPVAVGETGLVELASFGTDDVRATLFDVDGKLVAASDDRPDDWNFAIGRNLDAGDYTLQVEPVGAAQGRTVVSMRRPPLVEEAPLAPPASLDLVVSDAAHLYPLALPATAELVLIAARADEGVGLALERRQGETWRTAAVATGERARLEVPVRPGHTDTAGYRVRLWSLDRRESPVRMEVAAVVAPEATEARLASGLALSEVEGFGPGGAVGAVRLDRPGLLRESATAGLRFCPVVDEPCREWPGGLVPATSERILVVADVARGTRPPQARATRVVLEPGAEGLVVPLPGGEPLLCDVAESPGGPLLLQARSLAGQPGIEPLGSRTETPAPDARMAVGLGSSVAVQLRGNAGTVRLWRATPEATETQVRVSAYAEPRQAALVAGVAEGALEEGEATQVDLPDGPRLVRLTLEPGLVAVISQGDEPQSVHWASGVALAEAVETTGDRLTLLHGRDPGGTARYVVESLPLPEGVTAPLAPKTPLERTTDRAAVLRLHVAPLEEGGTLHVRGASQDAVLVDASGEVQRGPDLDLAPGRGGALSVPHRPGLLLAWVAPSGAESPGPWPAEASAAARPIAPPASLALSGDLARYEVTLQEPAVLHVRTTTPVATRLLPAGAAERVDVHPEGARLDAFLPEGSAGLTVRGLGAALTGRAELTTTPVTALTEGLGPRVLLAPGASRVFSFRLEHSGPIGIGVRASEDVVEARLLDALGTLLGTGAAQMPDLEPGDYLLELRAPPDAGPVTAQAALVGLDPPDTGPPEEVVRDYLERFAVRSGEEER